MPEGGPKKEEGLDEVIEVINTQPDIVDRAILELERELKAIKKEEQFTRDKRQKRFGLAVAAGVLGLALYPPPEYKFHKRDVLPVIEKSVTYRADFYAKRGHGHISIGKYDEAIEDFTKAIELDPKDSNYYDSRGQSYYEQEKYDQAVLDFTRAIELVPRHAYYYFSRGSTYLKQGKVHLAIIDLTKAQELAPEDLYLKEEVEELKKRIKQNKK